MSAKVNPATSGFAAMPLSTSQRAIYSIFILADDRALSETFEKYGRVESCKVVCDRGTGRSRGFAFVKMETVEAAEDAKENLDGQELDGHRMRVDFSITKRAHTPTPGKYMGRPDQSARDRSYGGGGGGRYGGGGGGGYRSGGFSGGGYGGSRYGYRRSRSRSRSRSPYYRDRY